MVRRVPRRTDVGRTAQMRLTLEPFVSDAMREPCELPRTPVLAIRALCRLRRQFRWIPELSFFHSLGATEEIFRASVKSAMSASTPRSRLSL